MHVLAEGTGGFVIINNNDLLGGMQKVSQEQSQYYILGYEPLELTLISGDPSNVLLGKVTPH